MEYTYYIYSLKLVLYCLHFHKMQFQESNCLDKSFHLSHKLDHTQQTFVFMKTSWRRLEDVFRLRLEKTSSRRLDQDEYVRLSLTSSENAFKTSWSRPIYLSWPYVFKVSSRRLQDVFKTSSKHLQDVLKTSSRLPAKISSRRFQVVPSS